MRIKAVFWYCCDLCITLLSLFFCIQCRNVWFYLTCRFPAWRRPFHKASLWSDLWPSPSASSPLWVVLSYTPPAAKANSGSVEKKKEVVPLWLKLLYYNTILLLISWKWISHTFSTTSSLSKVTKPKPKGRWGRKDKTKEYVCPSFS